MAKQYGLILASQQKRAAAPMPTRELRPSIFNESSDDDNDNPPPQLRMKAAPIASGAMERRLARQLQEKALEEDPTVFQYDELYDEMENKREEEKQSKSKEPKNAKYIGKLLESAERRKLENELRIERQVQKEREAEGEQFRDKESFVTSSYRKKLEEMRKMEEQEQREDYLEAIGDVTKQQDLDGFYRHLYEQKTGSDKTIKTQITNNIENTSAEDPEISYQPIKSGRPQKRAYRKRNSQSSDNEETEVVETESKKTHLQNNIDADSDFSIDSSSSSDEDDTPANDTKNTNTVSKPDEKQKTAINESQNMALNLNAMRKEKAAESEAKEEISEVAEPPSEPELPKLKKDRTEIWKKRTIGEVYDEAVKRYLERKALRRA